MDGSFFCSGKMIETTILALRSESAVGADARIRIQSLILAVWSKPSTLRLRCLPNDLFSHTLNNKTVPTSGR